MNELKKHFGSLARIVSTTVATIFAAVATLTPEQQEALKQIVSKVLPPQYLAGIIMVAVMSSSFWKNKKESQVEAVAIAASPAAMAIVKNKSLAEMVAKQPDADQTVSDIIAKKQG